MSKKTKFYLVVILATVVLLGILYYFSRPKEAPVIEHTTNQTNLAYRNVNQFVYNQNEPVALFFYHSEDPDSQLVIRNMLDVLKSEYNINTFENLYYVDLKGIKPEEIDTYIKTNWNLDRYPTFLVMTIENSTVSIGDVLQWQKNAPYSIDDVHEWLSHQGMMP